MNVLFEKPKPMPGEGGGSGFSLPELDAEPPLLLMKAGGGECAGGRAGGNDVTGGEGERFGGIAMP